MSNDSVSPYLTVINKYAQDIDCMRSYTALREKMLFNQTLYAAPPLIQSTRKANTRPAKAVLPVIDYTYDDSVILAIQNDPKFINIIMNCRKQKSLLAYIFIESEYNYITCIVKTPDSFPFIIVRLPINKKYIYAKQVSNCYEFPLVDIISKDIKFNKSSSYSILLKYNGKNVQFIYDIYNASSEPNRITIDNISVGSMSIIDNLFNAMMMNSYRYMNKTNAMYSNTEVPSMLTFDTMNILVLKEANSVTAINFSTKQSSTSNNYFKVTDANTLVYINETNNKQNETMICSKDDSIVWALNDVGATYTLMNFESLFKVNYNRSILQNDRIYYVFTSFLNNYMFIKVITSLEIDGNNVIDTFIKTFSKDYQIIEAYMCCTI